MNVTAMMLEPQQGHRRLMAVWRDLKGELLQGREHIMVLKPKTRSTAQNARMWVLLEALARQVIWHGQKLTAAEWKTMCTAALKKQRVLPGLDGGFVVMGDSTRAMTVAEMVELQEFIECFGTQHDVDFGDVPAADHH